LMASCRQRNRPPRDNEQIVKNVIRHPLVQTLAGIALLCMGAVSTSRAGFADGTGPGAPETIYIPEADKKVSVNEHLGATLPLDAWLTDESGKSVQLREYFSGHRKPVILQIGYFRCPMLCSQLSRGLVDSLKKVKVDAGPDYDIVFLSIDPKETPELAAQKKNSFIHEYARDGSENAWHLLTSNKLQIDRVTEAAGVEYRWVGQAQQYSHPAVIVIASPEGKICRYLYGVNFDSQTLRLSLVEASAGKIGSTADSFILTCFQYDGHQGKYALAAINLMKLGGLLTILLLCGFIVRHLMNEHHGGSAGPPGKN
ncbi:MAG TPA: SCO family protein, partial [Tepidisphaeraceae bacterium]|nr:SCO family protein [Tepidisphaeraceae bacterium]